MERLGGEGTGQTSSIRQVALASFIGTAIEWYDFFLYGTAAALVFGQLFFPEATPLQGTLLAFATYGVGFFARPVGGIIFGHYGDRIGRKTMLVLSLLIMGIATFLIGLLPTFESVGVLAPILLVVLRLFQGVGVGGEWGGAVLMAVEHAPAGRRGFFGSWPQMGVPAGLLLANVVFLLSSTAVPEEQFLAWGWRIPFLLSIILVGVGLFIRLRIIDRKSTRLNSSHANISYAVFCLKQKTDLSRAVDLTQLLARPRAPIAVSRRPRSAPLGRSALAAAVVVHRASVFLRVHPCPLPPG